MLISYKMIKTIILLCIFVLSLCCNIKEIDELNESDNIFITLENKNITFTFEFEDIEINEFITYYNISSYKCDKNKLTEKENKSFIIMYIVISMCYISFFTNIYIQKLDLMTSIVLNYIFGF